ncbi:hypothetical protein BRC74_01425 [Halobacteriales archaeon QH_7_68_42]|jgi:DNA-directed RNA polymerase subunit RPC12/RpoP|nr:MAG: hypothetical protein BRC60_06915 [Halobacteriales archaeon QH_1_68_42]PSP54229.1 MAG: hypothetical protein BRC74_01425 [Halobacteriales archaeon QH_7_68_42]
MGMLETVTDVLRASTQNPNRGEDPTAESEGAYWCHDCGERALDLDVEGDDAPTCPTCGETMEFERSVGSTGCAC